MLFDLPIDELKTFLPERNEPEDFDRFWSYTLLQLSAFPLEAEFTLVDYGLMLVETYDVTFRGYENQPIKGWLVLPKGGHQVPCVVKFIGYGGGRGIPLDWLLYPNAGFGVFVMDTRGQGSEWLPGDTPDIPSEGSSPHFPGFMTLGVLDPKTYYYRRVYSDAVQALAAARSHPRVDARHVAVSGSSQGGGIALAVGGLVSDVAAVLADVPFLCHFSRAVTLTDEMPYGEISRFLKIHRDKKEQVFHTLSFFDGMNFAVRARAPGFFSVGLMDTICPPSTVFAAFNHYRGEKQIKVYEFNMHEGGDSFQDLERIKFLKGLWD